MKVCTVGLGYIGLPTSIMFASHNVEVVGVDINPTIVKSLNKGITHIKNEPHFDELFQKALEDNKFRAALKPEDSDAFIIAVPTPNKNDAEKSCDLTYVLDAVMTIIPYLRQGSVIIIESTVSPRSMDDEIKPLLEQSGFVIGEDIFLAHCPERVLPGQIMHELIYNNRIVGGITEACTEAAAMVYSTFVKGEIIKTTAKTAEMSKLMENTFRDVNIALSNEFAKICNDLNINVLDAIDMANKHPRVNILSPGPGVGGHCLAVDPYFISSKTPEKADLIKTARSINNSMPAYVIEQIDNIMKKINGRSITIFGLTYKGNVNDTRKSPAMEIFEELYRQGKYDLRAYDPYVTNNFAIDNMGESVKDSDLVVVLTDHNEFKHLDYTILNQMNNKIIFDTKNIVIDHGNPEFTILNYGNIIKYLSKEALVV